MRGFNDARRPDTEDQLWLLEHPPVFTLGQAGRLEHLLDVGTIPVVHSDRGGQVTYHGPGQLIAYLLLDLRRRGIGVRRLVNLLEQSVIDLLARQGIESNARSDAPGVYVEGAKIASLGLRVRDGCCYHGLALIVELDDVQMVSTTMKRLLLLALSYFREGRCMKCLRVVNPEKFFFRVKSKDQRACMVIS